MLMIDVEFLGYEACVVRGIRRTFRIASFTLKSLRSRLLCFKSSCKSDVC